jgi:hypothetical protein
MIKTAWTHEQSDNARKQGWDLWDADGELQLQRVDEMETFDSDLAAWKHVWAHRDDDPLCDAALKILKKESSKEYRRLYEAVTK